MKSYAQIAYESYSAQAGGRSLATGDPLPTWDRLAENIKAGWEAVAVGILRAMRNATGAELAASLMAVRDG